MKGSKKDLISYHLARAWEIFDDAKILADNEKWNSTINRLYYSGYYDDLLTLIGIKFCPILSRLED